MPMFDITQVVKIWFSKPGGPCLGKLNEYRLISHRSKFPKDKITLVSNIENLTDFEHKYLVEFCKRWNINLIGLKSIKDKIAQSETIKDKKNQLELLRIAELEITSSHDYGNLGAASDIVRVLSPVAKLGIYTDLDIIKINTKLTSVNSPLGVLLSGYIFYKKEQDETEVDSFSNDIFACDESSTSFLIHYRTLMLKRYTNYKDFQAKIKELYNLKNIFDSKQYNKAAGLYKADYEKQMPAVLKFRKAMKSTLKSGSYDKFLEEFVKFTSGPCCMSDVVRNIFLKTEVIPACDKMCNRSDHDKYASILNAQFVSLTPSFGLSFRNEDDVSWVKSLDNTGEKLERMEKAAITLQSHLRTFRAKKELLWRKSTIAPYKEDTNTEKDLTISTPYISVERSTQPILKAPDQSGSSEKLYTSSDLKSAKERTSYLCGLTRESIDTVTKYRLISQAVEIEKDIFKRKR